MVYRNAFVCSKEPIPQLTHIKGDERIKLFFFAVAESPDIKKQNKNTTNLTKNQIICSDSSVCNTIQDQKIRSLME